MLLKPVLEQPVDTAQDILDRGMTVLTQYGEWGESWGKLLKESSNPVYNQIAQNMDTPKTQHEKLFRLQLDVLEQGTHVYLSIVPLLIQETDLGHYHYSREVVEGTAPFAGWIINKMWPLNEDLQKHILIFQQAGLVNINMNMKISSPVQDIGLQVVQIQHLIFSFAILGSGIMAAFLVFLIEIYFKK